MIRVTTWSIVSGRVASQRLEHLTPVDNRRDLPLADDGHKTHYDESVCYSRTIEDSNHTKEQDKHRGRDQTENCRNNETRTRNGCC